MKKWYQSKTIGGILIALVGTALLALGVDPGVTLPVNPDVVQVQDYVTQVQNAHGNISTILGIALSAFGTVLGIIGRIKAETAIGKTS